MNTRRNLHTILIQIGIAVALLLFTPMIIYAFSQDLADAEKVLCNLAPPISASFVIFMLNYWLLVPRFYYKGLKWLYFLANILLIVAVIDVPLFSAMFKANFEWEKKGMFLVMAIACFMTLMFFGGAAALAFAARNSVRTKALKEQMQEEKRRHAEAELVWLKNQLNPHFLFNTLNNISALVAFDAEQAQDSISRLSDLLRYAMYESAKPSVALPMEVDFMKDYISLMSLRCNSRTTVTTNFDISSPGAHIAPLLLISIIENAFKHGVSANRASEINISMLEKDGLLTFECSNTNHAKGADDNSGSGIGLANMRRRLDLLYAGRYEWEQSDSDGIFSIKIKIRL